IRSGHWRLVPMKKILFFGLWLLPAFLFHIFISMNPDQAGYSVFFLPALFVLLGPSVKYVLAEISRVKGQPYGASPRKSRRCAPDSTIYRMTALIVIAVNGLFFLFSG